MKISSHFKDYYDYVEYLYSQEGGDSQNFYQRRNLSSDTDNLRVPCKTDRIPFFPASYRVLGERNEQRCMWCSVCGKLYLLVAPENDYWPRFSYRGPDYFHWDKDTSSNFSLLTEDSPIFSDLSRLYSAGHYLPRGEVTLDRYLGVSNEVCTYLSKKLLAPVFFIYSMGREKQGEVLIPSEVPNLGKLGFAKIIPAEQMYQEIAMFLTQLKENPDSLPPARISDKDRLVQKGFDAKVSFRGKVR